MARASQLPASWAGARRGGLAVAAALCLPLGALAQTPAQDGGGADEPSGSSQADARPREPYNTGWSFYLDNDALALLGRDQQYTGGFALSLSGRRAAEYWWSLDPVLEAIDGLTGFRAVYGEGRRIERHNLEFGASSFTPDAIGKSEPIRDDHPYANVVFLSNTQQSVHVDDQVSYQSTFALGVLGTDAAEEFQGLFHELSDSQEPRGWDNQISDGGEPTFNYVVNRQEPLLRDADRRGIDYDVRTTVGATVGYTTQVMAGLNWRWGRIRTPWWGFNPDFAEYINLGTPVKSRSVGDNPVHELFLWGSLQVRQRFYNAVLEGQFRDSEVTFDRDELDSTLAEASVGVTCGLASGTRLSFAIRARERELEGADGVNPVWGSLIITQAY